MAVHQSPKPFNMLRSEDYTEQDWAQLGRMFTNEFKPALQKWCSAYRGHISIRPEDLKLENFRGQLGVRTSPLQTISYSFVVGDTTITFGERDGNAFVFQMMTGQAAKDTSSPPPPGTVPNLNVPATSFLQTRSISGRQGPGLLYKAGHGLTSGDTITRSITTLAGQTCPISSARAEVS